MPQPFLTMGLLSWDGTKAQGGKHFGGLTERKWSALEIYRAGSIKV